MAQRELEDKPVAASQVADNLKSSANRDAAAKMLGNPSPPQPQTTPKLALIPLRSVAFSKNSKQQHQETLEAKQFPIVLGRTNLSQWWYQSCDCQQYYCRFHCRPVAKNIGSLSKVMIQIDTKGTAHIVGKNPHLVTVITPERGNNNNGSKSTNDVKDNGSSNKDNKNSVEKKDDNLSKDEYENTDEQQQPIVLRVNDIVSIGRRDREPWMRFQVVENTAAANAVSSAKKDSVVKNMTSKTNDGIARETAGAGEVVKKEASLPEAPRQLQPAHDANQGKTKIQSVDVANAATSAQQRNTHHDDQFPEWITTTTTTNAATGKRSRLPSSYDNYGTTDTKQQQNHQAMVATLTKAAAAAGAVADVAADADERNKSKKHYRYNSYYNYYNQSNYEADSSAAQRKRRRHNTSSFAPYHHGLSFHSNKSVIRSAADLFHNGSSRRGGRLQGHHNDPQIHLVFQDYETSARLIHAGTRRGRNKTILPKETDNNDVSNNNNMNKSGEPHHSRKIQRKHARTDRNFIGISKEERMNNITTNTFATACNTNGVCDGDKTQNQQSKSMGLLSKNYAAALLEVSTPSVALPEVDGTAMDNMPPPVVLPGEQAFQSQHHR